MSAEQRAPAPAPSPSAPFFLSSALTFFSLSLTSGLCDSVSESSYAAMAARRSPWR